MNKFEQSNVLHVKPDSPIENLRPCGDPFDDLNLFMRLEKFLSNCLSITSATPPICQKQMRLPKQFNPIV